MKEKEAQREAMPLDIVRRKLAFLWFTGAGVICAVLIVQTLRNHYLGDPKKVWDWYIPLIMPTLLTMVGVLAGSAVGRPEKQSVNRSFYHLVYGLSVAYLIMIAAPILAQPVSPLRWDDLLKDADYWLAGAKSLVVAAIGYLFASKQKTEVSKSPANEPEPAVVD